MIFRQLFERESCTYTYLLACPETRAAALIDPVITEVPKYLQLLHELDLTLVYALDTHTHADHITGAGELREQTGCKTLLGEQAQSPCVSEVLSHGDKIQVGSLTLTALYTPGHTSDSYSFWLEENCEHYLFSGDTLLIRGTGRTDFQNGNARDQYRSLFEILLKLPSQTKVYPAHDYKGWMVSSIAEEQAHNPRLQVTSIEDYEELMNNLKLPHPTLMDIAVPANRSCGKTDATIPKGK
ncbi:MAG TPA: MBL fold metallo-hydrolase [Cellvibrio sp.]|nr:MBL fold metallo-hydrolase [Cellvibrio sp.]